MRFSIISEIPGRTRLQLAGPVPESDLDALLKLSGDIDGVHNNDPRYVERTTPVAELHFDEAAELVRSTLRPLPTQRRVT